MFMILIALLAFAGWQAPMAQAGQPAPGPASLQGPAAGGQVLLCRLDPSQSRRRAVDPNQHSHYSTRAFLPILRINRITVRAGHVIVELKRHGTQLLTDEDYANTRVTVSAHASGVPYHQISLSSMDRLRHLNSDIRVINWVSPLVITEPANVRAVLTFRGNRYTKTQGLVP